MNLREWHQKQRFGIDFLYPIDRYVAALDVAAHGIRAAGNPFIPTDAGVSLGIVHLADRTDAQA